MRTPAHAPTNEDHANSSRHELIPAWPAHSYPKQAALRDGSTVSIRQLNSEDTDVLLAFFRAISEEERFFLKDDVTSPQVISDWLNESERAFAIVAEYSSHIVGQAALVRRRGKARAHLVDVRLVVAEDFRHRGLGTALIRELCEVACDAGFNILFEAVEGAQAEALAAADSLGFVRLGRIYGAAIDPKGRLHDIVLMAMPLRRWRESAGK